MLYRQIARRILFGMDPEDAHLRTMRLLSIGSPAFSLAAPMLRVADPRLGVSAFGLDFPNPVGLAAGLDKHAEAVGAWPRIGLGFVELGTVTPRPQSGNPRPRLFRLVEDRALVNRMGFNSAGAQAVAAHLARAGRPGIPVGINVGKNRDTPNDTAAEDYRSAIRTLLPHADYFVINVSSPNTAGLRDLQRPAAIRDLIATAIAAARREDGHRVPVLVKISPDQDDAALQDTVDAIRTSGADGIIATNTTVSREGLRSAHAGETGGLSGAPVRQRANAVCRRIYEATGGSLPIVGVGGIFSADDAYERIRSGATLVQIYTALIYEGPALVARINRGLLRLMERDGVSRIADAVGRAVR